MEVSMISVIVAESDLLTAELLTMTLKFAGFTVTRARGGLEVLELARSKQPHVILANVKLAQLGGCEMCRVVRADQRLSGTKVVLFGSPDAGDVGWREAGADGFLQKPISVRWLPGMLRALVSGGERVVTSSSAAMGVEVALEG
jgi:DNA-binding response OmpR family regulator